MGKKCEAYLRPRRPGYNLKHLITKLVRPDPHAGFMLYVKYNDPKKG